MRRIVARIVAETFLMLQWCVRRQIVWRHWRRLLIDAHRRRVIDRLLRLKLLLLEFGIISMRGHLIGLMLWLTGGIVCIVHEDGLYGPLDVVQIVPECFAARDQRAHEPVVREQLAIYKHVKQRNQACKINTRLLWILIFEMSLIKFFLFTKLYKNFITET